MPQVELIGGDRRAGRRYALQLNLRFSYEYRGIAYRHTGRTEDMGRGGIRFQTDCPPPVGASLQVQLAWPFLLQNVCPLELWIWGKVVRSDAAGTVVQMASYEFRTCGERSFEQASSGLATCNMVG